MQEIIKLLIAVGILILGIPLGTLLAKLTKEELKDGQKWFRLIIFCSLVLAIVGLIIGKDFMLFGFCFIAIVTGMSLRKNGNF